MKPDTKYMLENSISEETNLRFTPFDSSINLNSIRPYVKDELFCYNKTKTLEFLPYQNNPNSYVKNIDSRLNDANGLFIKSTDNNIDDILSNIELSDPICLSLLFAFNIPSPIAQFIARSFIKSTLDYLKKE